MLFPSRLACQNFPSQAQCSVMFCRALFSPTGRTTPVQFDRECISDWHSGKAVLAAAKIPRAVLDITTERTTGDLTGPEANDL